MKKTAISLLLALVLLSGLVLVAVPKAEAVDYLESGLDHSSSDPHCICGGIDATNGIGEGTRKHNCSATVSKPAQWTAWTDATSLPTAGGYYYLTTDVTLTATWTAGTADTAYTAANNIYLCLNGKTITGPAAGNILQPAKYKRVFICDCHYSLDTAGNYAFAGNVVSTATTKSLIDFSGATATISTGAWVSIFGGNWSAPATSTRSGPIAYINATSYLQVYNGILQGSTLTDAQYGGVIYANKGYLNVYGGKIQGGKGVKNGGSIYTAASCALNITGGTITGGTATTYGGNIYAAGDVTISGGTISGGKSSSHGGNIFATGAKSMTVSGGTITGGQSSGRGGNIYTGSSRVLTISGGTISGGKASSHGGNLGAGGQVTMTGGVMENGTAGLNGGNLYITETSETAITGGTVRGGKDQLKTGIYIANTASAAGKPVTLTATGIQDAIYVHLNQDRAAAQKVTVSAPANVYVQLSGYDLTADISTTGSGKLYGMDTATDDFQVNAETPDYGRILGTLTGNIASGEKVGLGSNYRYYALQEAENTYSFHRVAMDITGGRLDLQPDGSVSVSYTATFQGDSKIAAALTEDGGVTFGIAMTGNGSTASGGLSLAQIQAMLAAGQPVTVNCTLQNVLTPNGTVNGSRAISQILGSTTLHIGGTAIHSGDYAGHTLKSVMEAMDASALSPEDAAMLADIYEAYDPLMAFWNTPNTRYALAASVPTEAQLQQQVVDYMYALCTVQWTPVNTITFNCDCNHPQTYHAGVTYTGLPYTHNCGSLEKFNSVLENGVMPGTVTDVTYLGADCADSIFWAWSQISSDIRFTLTSNAICANGTLPVGNYTLSSTTSTREICTYNTEQGMYQAYAQVKMGDAVLYADPSGHIRMAAQDAHVEYNADGTINPTASYIITHEQGGSSLLEQNHSTCLVNKKQTFQALFRANYIPITIAAFTQGEDLPEMTMDNLDLTASGMGQGKISSDYRINHVTLKVTGADVAYEQSDYPRYVNTIHTTCTFDLSSVDWDLPTLTAGEAYTYEIWVSVGGQDILVHSYYFTA